MKDQGKALDRALDGASVPTDDELASMFEVGTRIRDSLQVEAPLARREKAMFVQASTLRQRSTVVRRVTAVALVGALAVVGILARGARPGQPLYPVRKFLSSAGLATAAIEEVNQRLDAAQGLIQEADVLIITSPPTAEKLARKALGELGVARTSLADVSQEQALAPLSEIRALEARAVQLIRNSAPAVTPTPAPTLDDNGGDNSSSGSDDGTDDNSGSGSDDGTDDNSGSGSDDSGSGDNSGSGGGDDTSGSDNSGPGNDDSDSTDDNQGGEG